MNRHRLYFVDWPTHTKHIAEGFLADSYANSKMSGFLVDRLRRERLDARFVEKYVREIDMVDPFGSRTSQTRIEYRVTGLAICRSKVGLELLNPARGSRQVMNRIAALFERPVAIDPIEVQVDRWISGIRKASNLELSVTAVKLSGVDIGGGSTCDILARGGRNLQKRVRAAAPKDDGRMTEARLRLFGVPQAELVLYSSGGFDCTESVDEPMRDVLRDSLLEAVVG